MIHILIADPDPVTRKALANLIAHRLGVKEILEAGDMESLIRVLADTPIDLLLLDWSLQGSPAPETSRLLQRACANLQVVLLSVDENDAETAKCAGAEFIHKGASPDKLINTLKPLLMEDRT